MSEAQVEVEAPRPLYQSPKGLHPFQVKGIAQWILLRSLLCTWETGCGKSHLTLAGGAMLFEEEMIDLLVVVCEQNKTKEWLLDFEKFTGLRAVRYRGTPDRRRRIRESVGQPGGPQVLIMTYETSRNDLGSFVKEKTDGRTKKVWAEGPLAVLMRTASVEGRGLAVVYDESSKLSNRFEAGHPKKVRNGYTWVPQRGSVNYKAQEHVLADIRKAGGDLWVTGMTGTKVERNPEGIFNQVRLISPAHAGTVASFQKDHIRYTDAKGNSGYKNIGPDDDHREPWVTTLLDKIAPIHSHKSKTDPDIAAAFPVPTEEPMYVSLSKEHLALYNAVDSLREDEELFPEGPSESDERVLMGILRQIAAHPLVLAHSNAAAIPGTLANLIVERVGYEALAAIKVNKVEELVEKLRYLCHGQGGQAIVFTFFGPTLIPILRDRLAAEGFTSTSYFGGMSNTAKEESVTRFRAGEFEVLLASDAASRGLNIPEAQYVINYELCLTDGRTTQRINRVSRLDSGHSTVTSFSMIALGTIEEVILAMNLTRQRWEEYLTPESEDQGDTDEGEFMRRLTAQQRREMFDKAKRKKLDAA